MRKKKQIKIIAVAWLAVIMVLSISIGYSAFGTTLKVTGIVSKVRLQSDMRITGVTPDSITNSGLSTYAEYNKNNLQLGVNLPNEDSTVTYKIDVTNYDNAVTGLLEITGLPENLEYSLNENFNLKEKICDSSGNCILGATNSFYITIKYADGKYDGEITVFPLTLEFNFQQVYSVTYTNITNNNYPTEILATDTLIVDFGNSAPNNLSVKVGGIQNLDYEYENGILTLENVDGNVEISKVNTTLVQHIKNIYSSNTTADNNDITYNFDTKNSLMNDRLGGKTSDLDAGNIRYYGVNPNNYIDIGERDSNGDTVLWRIIGVFKNMQAVDGNTKTSKDLVKIVRTDSLGKYSFNDNNWADTTVKTSLDNTYYSSLLSTVKSKIQKVVWPLGGISSDTNMYVDTAYGLERGNTVFGDNATEWEGNIGLIYPSDYGYSADMTSCRFSSLTFGFNCESWLDDKDVGHWTMTHVSSSSTMYRWLVSTGLVNTAPNYNRNIYPVLYLTSDLVITGGDGGDGVTTGTPYTIE